METLTQPTLLLKPFAENGDKNTIPVVNQTIAQPQLADLTSGFPPITSLDPSDGGLPPERADFNALGYLTTTYDFFYQAGGTFTFNVAISNAIGGYPLGARLWYTNSDGLSCILRSTIANNTNDFTQDDTVIGDTGSGKPWEVENFRGISNQGTLFDCKWTDHILNDISWLRADTFSWQSGLVYSAAYQHLVADEQNGIIDQHDVYGSIDVPYTLAPDGHKIVPAAFEQTVIDAYNATGVGWYYILDTTNQRFKLPRTKFGFTGLRNGVGNYVAAGLPDHTHTIRAAGNTTDYHDRNGSAMHVLTDSWGSGRTAGVSKASSKASEANSVYGSSDTVQPRATQMYLYFYVGRYVQSAIEQTAGLNAELFNEKMDLDAENTTSATVNTLIGKADSAAKRTIVSWGIPDYSARVSKTKGTSYTADNHGFLIGSDIYTATGGTSAYVYINGINVRVSSSQDNYSTNTWCYPIAKGWTYSYSGGASMSMYFVPAIGG